VVNLSGQGYSVERYLATAGRHKARVKGFRGEPRQLRYYLDGHHRLAFNLMLACSNKLDFVNVLKSLTEYSTHMCMVEVRIHTLTTQRELAAAITTTHDPLSTRAVPEVQAHQACHIGVCCHAGQALHKLLNHLVQCIYHIRVVTQKLCVCVRYVCGCEGGFWGIGK